MRIFKFFFAVLIFFGLCFCVIYYKNHAARKIVLQTLSDNFKSAEINVTSVSYELPDELVISKMDLKYPEKYLSVNFSKIKFEFYPSNFFSYIKNKKMEDILESFIVRINQLTYKDISFDSTDITAVLSQPDMVYSGDVLAEKIKYKKINFLDVVSKFSYSEKVLALNTKSATFAGGRIHGSINIDFTGQKMNYEGDLFLSNLGSSELMVIFSMDRKMDMTGKWNGEIHFSGTLDKIENITGFLVADERGGELNIKDKAMIDKIASKVQAARDEITESVAHHDYKEGNMSIGVERDSIKIGLSLSGKTGNRNFDIYLHDFLFK